jgi:medium-chain acyl-[acyl-carrier-protein] hydrolase
VKANGRAVPSAAFIRRDPRPHAEVRLFCFPYAGGGASVFRHWSAELPQDIELLAVQLPGRETRLREPPLADIAAMVDALAGEIVPFLDRPAAFFGHSMGGLLAFELARRLAQSGTGAVASLFVSARRAPRLPMSEAPLHALDDDAFVAEIQRRYGGIPDGIAQHRDLLALLLPALRADILALETYRYEVGPLLRCPIIGFGGTADVRVRETEMAGWAHETRGPFTRHLIRGGHFFLQSQRSQVLGIVAGALLSDATPENGQRATQVIAAGRANGSDQ